MTYDGVILKPDLDEALEHYGVLGMKWGHRKKRPVSLLKGRRNYTRTESKKAMNEINSYYKKAKAGKGLKTRSYEPMKISSTDSSITKGVKNDFNKMNDQQFMNKYKVSKKVYQKRVKKYGDPYKHTVNSGYYKVLKKLSGR